MQKVRLGFIGVSEFAVLNHFPSLKKIDTAELVAVCDLDMNLARSAAGQFGIKHVYPSYQEMLSKQDLDAVYVIMAPQRIRQPVLDCLAAGKHVFVEKPLGANLDVTRALAAAAKKSGSKTMVAFNRRFTPVIRKAKEIVEARGPIMHCSIEYTKQHNSEENLYYTGLDIAPIGTFFCDAVHQVDALRFMCGEATHAIGTSRQLWGDHYDNCSVGLAVFENGSIGSVTANFASATRIERYSIHGRGISAVIYPPEYADIYQDGSGSFRNGIFIPEPVERIDGIALSPGDQKFQTYGYLQENEHFIESILNDREPDCNFADSLKTAELVSAMQKYQLDGRAPKPDPSVQKDLLEYKLPYKAYSGPLQ